MNLVAADAPGSGHQSGNGALPKISLPALTQRLRFNHGRPLLAVERYLASAIVGFHRLDPSLFFSSP